MQGFVQVSGVGQTKKKAAMNERRVQGVLVSWGLILSSMTGPDLRLSSINKKGTLKMCIDFMRDFMHEQFSWKIVCMEHSGI